MKRLLYFWAIVCLPVVLWGQLTDVHPAYPAATFRYWFDTDISSAVTDSALFGVRTIDASALREGLHTLHYQVMDSTGRPSYVASSIFYRSEIKQQQRIASALRVWYDTDYSNVDTIYQWSGTMMMDVNHLNDGLHTIYCQIVEADGSLSSVRSMAFIKLNQTFRKARATVTQYSYWFNEEDSTAITVVVPNPQDTFILNSIQVPVMPVRMENFQFAIVNGGPRLYARHTLQCRFEDIFHHQVTSEVSTSFVDYHSYEDLTNVAVLHSKQTIYRSNSEDEYRWYCFRAYTGDTIQIRATSESSITIYSPLADTLYDVSGSASQSFTDVPISDEGIYYVSVHNINKGTLYFNYLGSGDHLFPVRFQNYDGTLLEEQLLPLYAIPQYTGISPRRPSDDEHSYYFSGWNPEIEEVTDSAVYTAQYTAGVRKFLIVFQDYDGTELSQSWAERGEMPIPPSAPQRPATVQYSYTFRCWEPVLTKAESDAVYTAIYDSVLNEYPVSFLNYDQSLLQKVFVPYGSIPVYIGDTPECPPDQIHSFIFRGWDRPFEPVLEATQYVAQYDTVPRQYRILFLDYDGSEIAVYWRNIGNETPYPEEPIREPDDIYTYTFSGWSPQLADTVSDDAIYQAQYQSALRTYTIEVITPYGYCAGEGTYTVGSTATISVTNIDHYHVAVWLDGNDTIATEQQSVMVKMNSDKVILAEAALDRFNISGAKSPYGIVEGYGCYEYGSFVTLWAIPNDGYNFVQWSDKSIYNPYVLYVESAVEITPEFTPTDNCNIPSHINVYTIRHSLHVKQENEEIYEVFDIQGQCIYKGLAPVVELPANGMYVVVTSTTINKVIVQ